MLPGMIKKRYIMLSLHFHKFPHNARMGTLWIFINYGDSGIAFHEVFTNLTYAILVGNPILWNSQNAHQQFIRVTLNSH